MDLRSENFVSNPIMKIRRRGDLIFGEDHEEEAAQFDCLDRLHYPESPSVADVEHPNGKPRWVWGPAAQT